MDFYSQEAVPVFRSMVSPLLAWYDAAARVMPWRLKIPVPYYTLVSEIMLQQTRVETVIPYFERFIRELPSIQALADADEEKLLKLWEGLGYYSRVRNLQKAARAVVNDFAGRLPSDRDSLLRLPGIGEYTAGAIASIAFGLPEPAVDGNVLRVCTRLVDCHADIADPAFRKSTRLLLKAVYPPGRCSDFTQGIMDLGAMICLPGNPRCGGCPLRPVCLGYRNGTAPALPRKQAQKARKAELKTVFLLRSDTGKIALRKRPDRGILAGLWEYPSAEGTLTREEAREWLEKHQVPVIRLRKGNACKHIFTHREWHMTSWQADCSGENPAFTWATPQELAENYSLPGAFKGFRSSTKKRRNGSDR